VSQADNAAALHAAASRPPTDLKHLHRNLRLRVVLGELLLPSLKYWLPGALLLLLCVWWVLSMVSGKPATLPTSAMSNPGANSFAGPRAADVSVILILAVLSVLLATTIERSRRILVRTLALPEELVKGGWSAEAVAQHLARGIDRIASAGGAPAMPLLLDASPRPDIIVPSTTLSVATAAAWLGEFLGLRPRSIAVELLAPGPGRIAIWLRPEPGQPITGGVVPASRLADALAALGERAAEAVAPYNFVLAGLRTKDEARSDQALATAQRAGDSAHLPATVRAACLALGSILTFQRLCRATPKDQTRDAWRATETAAIEAAQQLNSRALTLLPDHPLALLVQALLERWRPDLAEAELRAWIARAGAVRPHAERYFAEPTQLIETLVEIETDRRVRRWEALGWAAEGLLVAFHRGRLARAQDSLKAARKLLRDVRNNGAPVMASLFMDRLQDVARTADLLAAAKSLPPDLAEGAAKLRKALQRVLADTERALPAIKAAQLRYADQQARYEQSVAYFEHIENARWTALRASAEQGDGPPVATPRAPD
jgi:hypothetical protein